MKCVPNETLCLVQMLWSTQKGLLSVSIDVVYKVTLYRILERFLQYDLVGVYCHIAV